MKTKRIFSLLLVAILVAGCASTPKGPGKTGAELMAQKNGTAYNSDTQLNKKSSTTGKIIKGIALAPFRIVGWTIKIPVYTLDFVFSGPSARKRKPGFGNALGRVLINSALVAVQAGPQIYQNYQTQKAWTKYNNAVNDYNQTVSKYNQQAVANQQLASNLAASSYAAATPPPPTQAEAMQIVKKQWGANLPSPSMMSSLDYNTHSEFRNQVDALTGNR